MARMFRNIAKSERVLDLMRTFATMLAVAGVVFLLFWVWPIRSGVAGARQDVSYLRERAKWDDCVRKVRAEGDIAIVDIVVAAAYDQQDKVRAGADRASKARIRYANVTDPSICGPTPLPKD